MRGFGQHPCIFPNHFLPLAASSCKGCPGIFHLPHDPSRFRCFLSNWEYDQKKKLETFWCKVILAAVAQRSNFSPDLSFFLCIDKLQLPSKKPNLVPARAEWGHFYRLPGLLCNLCLFKGNNVKNLIHNLTTSHWGKAGGIFCIF